MNTIAVQAPPGEVPKQHEAIVVMHKDCPVCRAEGLTAHTRVRLRSGEQSVVATLYHATGDLVGADEAALSEAAWTRLALSENQSIAVSHLEPVESLAAVRSRIHGNALNASAYKSIIADVVNGAYSDIHLSAFVTACATRPLQQAEVLALTEAMVEVGEKMSWRAPIIVDKHSIGGLRAIVPRPSSLPS